MLVPQQRARRRNGAQRRLTSEEAIMSTWIGSMFGRTRRQLRHKPTTSRTSRQRTVSVKSVGVRLPFDGHLLDPTMRVMVVEDACWRATTEYWRSRRPAPWRLRDRARWRAEGVALREKRDRIRSLMSDEAADLPVRPPRAQ
jgi:hypothetical protein